MPNGDFPSTDSSLVTSGCSVEAARVFHYLQENFGKKILSGSFANVDWNANEAEWVFNHTGKFPAINNFDFIHFHESPQDWIDYGDIEPVRQWWLANGLVGCMWHWRVPANDGSSFSFRYGKKPDETCLSPSVIDDPLSDGYRLLVADMDAIARYLKLMRDDGIPVLWRPLHEGMGRRWRDGKPWFWWGAGGAEAYRNLWKMMYERFTHHHGLNNLIWVWTTVNDECEWYPGDEYVDIVSCDLYRRGMWRTNRIFKRLRRLYPAKILSLSECGDVPGIPRQWRHGARWSWFSVWYDYARTRDMRAKSVFERDAHAFADSLWWQESMACDAVLSRQDLPDFTQEFPVTPYCPQASTIP